MPGEECDGVWRGLIAVRPAVAEIDGEPSVIVPTFNPGNHHAAGLVALKIVVDNGMPHFTPLWQFPDPSSADAHEHFRFGPSEAVLASCGQGNGDECVWVVDVKEWDWPKELPAPEDVLDVVERLWKIMTGSATIYGVRVQDGVFVPRIQAAGLGRGKIRPLLHDGAIYLPSRPRGLFQIWERRVHWLEIRPMDATQDSR